MSRLFARLRTSRGPAPLWLLPMMLVLLSMACQVGSYPVDILPEMHYQTYIRSQEPPRKQAPIGSVPRTGGEVNYDLGAAATLLSPLAKSPDNLAKAKKLYAVNCAMCHGAEGKVGPSATVGSRFAGYNAPVPVDFSQARTKSRTEGQLFWFLTNGLGNMPAWKNLLTEEERWLLVQFVQSVQ